MKTHKIKPGECLASIAFFHGLLPDTIWNHPDNREISELRGDGNVLYPGDTLVIPGKQTEHVSCTTEQRHRFRRKDVPMIFRVRVCDHDEPINNEPYTLTIDDQSFTGSTDSDGIIEQPIPPSAKEGRLVLNSSENEYAFVLGHLDPIDTNEGVQSRLYNLGMDSGPVDGIVGPRTQAALKLFQRKYELEPTGEIDEVTRKKLKEAHGS